MTTREQALARIRLRHLQCFLAVAEAGNLRRAAEAMSVTQPAITKTLNELESMLGVRLFERGKRGTAPTPEAHDFMRHAQASVAALRQAVDSVSGRPGETAEVPLVRLGVLPTIAPSLLPRLLRSYRKAWPRVTLRVSTASNRHLIAALRANEIDLAVGRMSEPDAMSGLSFEGLYAEPLVPAVRAGHRWAPSAEGTRPGRTPKVRPADLARLHWLLPTAGTVIRHAADSWLAAHAVSPAVGVTETLSTSLARELVLDSDAVWFTPGSAVEADVTRGMLICLPLDTTGTEEPVGLLRPADIPARPSPALVALVEAIRQEAVRRREGWPPTDATGSPDVGRR